jgi:hypothetical protein
LPTSFVAISKSFLAENPHEDDSKLGADVPFSWTGSVELQEGITLKALSLYTVCLFTKSRRNNGPEGHSIISTINLAARPSDPHSHRNENKRCGFTTFEAK